MIQKFPQCGRNMKEFFAGLNRGAILSFPAGADRPQQDILGRVLHVDKFQHLNVIPFPSSGKKELCSYPRGTIA